MRPPQAQPKWPDPALLDGLLHAAEGRASGGLSPIAQGLALLDWGVHLANAPFRRAELAAAAANGAAQAGKGGARRDRRRAATRRPPLSGPGWRDAPFHFYAQAFLLAEQWWARGDARAARGQRRRSARRRFRRAAMASTCSRRRTCPGSIRKSCAPPRETGGVNFLRGRGQLVADAICAPRSAARRGRSRSRSARPRGDAGRGGVSQRADRTDPVRADDARGRARAGADRAGLDHEILHSRSAAREFADPLSRRPRPHRVRDFLAQSRRRACAISRSTITAARA